MPKKINPQAKPRLQQLLSRLGELEQSLPGDETKTYLSRLLEDETKKFQESFKSNPTVQLLDGFNSKLDQFKKDFNLTPVIDEIEKIQADIEDFKGKTEQDTTALYTSAQKAFSDLQELIQSTKSELTDSTKSQVSDLLERIDSLQGDLKYQTESSTQSGASLKSVVTELEAQLSTLSEQFRVSSENGLTEKEQSTKRLESINSALVEEIQKLRSDVFARLSNIGGGNANRQINVNSSVLSTRLLRYF